MTRVLLAWVVALSLLTHARRALADPPIAAADEAKTRFERGLQLFDEQEYERSLVEFERAYALTSSYRLLYNIGQVSAQLHHYAKAVSTFERYLAEGGVEIPVARRDKVQQELAEARSRTATLQVRVDQQDAAIAVDDLPFGTSPMAAGALLDSGRHRVTVGKAGFREVARVIALAGGETTSIDVHLESSEVRVEHTIVVEPPSRTPAWIAWGGTGALAVAAGTFGVLALGANGDLDRLRRTRGSLESERADKESDAVTFATVADVLGVAAIATGALALYLTLRKGSAPPRTRAWSAFGATF